MSENILSRFRSAVPWHRVVCAAALPLLLSACGGAVASGVATAKIGREVSASARSVPQGAEVCALKEAVAAPGGGASDKPLSDTCGKALKSDELWRRSMRVLGAYSETLDSLAAGAKAETTGPLEAAMTGVTGGDWVAVDDGPEKGAREAASQLVTQMKNNTSNGELEKAVKDAAPHVKVLCDGLTPYLDAQVKSLADFQKEIEKRRAAKTDRRCGMLDNRSVCVSESVVDRAFYGQLFGHATALAEAHEAALQSVTAFCAAHRKLEDAAAKGSLKDDGTYREIVEAVKAAHRPPEGSADSAPAPKK